MDYINIFEGYSDSVVLDVIERVYRYSFHGWFVVKDKNIYYDERAYKLFHSIQSVEEKNIYHPRRGCTLALVNKQAYRCFKLAFRKCEATCFFITGKTWFDTYAEWRIFNGVVQFRPAPLRMWKTAGSEHDTIRTGFIDMGDTLLNGSQDIIYQRRMAELYSRDSFRLRAIHHVYMWDDWHLFPLSLRPFNRTDSKIAVAISKRIANRPVAAESLSISDIQAPEATTADETFRARVRMMERNTHVSRKMRMHSGRKHAYVDDKPMSHFKAEWDKQTKTKRGKRRSLTKRYNDVRNRCSNEYYDVITEDDVYDEFLDYWGDEEYH